MVTPEDKITLDHISKLRSLLPYTLTATEIEIKFVKLERKIKKGSKLTKQDKAFARSIPTIIKELEDSAEYSSCTKELIGLSQKRSDVLQERSKRLVEMDREFYGKLNPISEAEAVVFESWTSLLDSVLLTHGIISKK